MTNGSFFQKGVPHYYGDYIRVLFILIAVVSLLSIPFVGYLIPLGIIPELCASLLFVLLAGLTNPHGKIVMACDAIVSGLGVFILELEAILFYSTNALPLFLIREITAVLLLFSFYYSVKSFRAMVLKKTGKVDRLWEFEDGEKTD